MSSRHEPHPDASSADAVIRKAGARMIWFLVLLYFFAVLDRVNVGFAALSMNRELGLTSEMFGIGATMFLVGYLLFELPNNLLLVRFGGRRTLARIAVGWGLATLLMVGVGSPRSFYALRFLVGVAEAGCLSSILFLLTLWFPHSHRGRYNALFMLSIPLTNALSAPISSALLGLDGQFGLAGWKWLFLVEGTASIVLGVTAWFYLTDRPSEARWLSPAERSALQSRLDAERPLIGEPRRQGLVVALTNPLVLMLAVAYTGLNMQLNTAAFWLPQIFRSLRLSNWEVAICTAVPFAMGGFAMFVWGKHSDRSGERVLHVIGAALVAGLGWGAAAFAGSAPVMVVCLSVATMGFFSATVVFWTLPSRLLGGASAASAIGLISATGGLGSAVAAPIVGRLHDSHHDWTYALIFVAAWSLMTPVLLKLLQSRIVGRTSASDSASVALAAG